MPTKEELDLYQKMDGGSGNAKDDNKVVNMLSSALEVPKDQLLAFVKTRDRSTVNGLKQVLEDMPDSQRPKSNGVHSKRSVGMGSPGQLTRSMTAPGLHGDHMNSTTPQNTAASRMAEHRLNEMCKMTSSYSSFFSSGGKQVPKTASPHENSFYGLRDDYRGSFNDWKSTAKDGQLRVFADTCRTLRYFNSPGLHTTTYGADFHTHDINASQCHLPEKDGQVSNVPLGNLNKKSPAEVQAGKVRHAFHEAQVGAARERENKILDGTLTRPEMRPKIKIHSADLITVNGAQPIGVDQGAPAPSRDWKPTARTSWNGDVHSKKQIAKHGCDKRITRGSVIQKEGANKHLFAKTMETIGTSGEMPFCVKNPKDPTHGMKINRFTYAKFAGFTP